METIKTLNLDELAQVSGGDEEYDEFGLCIILGGSTSPTANICLTKGVGAQGENWGIGFTLCAYIGFGAGGAATNDGVEENPFTYV